MSASDVLLVGIDIGTTNLKAVAVRASGRVEAVARRPMVIERSATGAAEFDLDVLDDALVALLAELATALAAKGLSAATVAGIAVASIGESFVGLDRDDRRATACPTWFDRRTANRRVEWGLSTRQWFDITGMVDDDIYTGYRIACLRETQPDQFGKVRNWLMVADYATFLLCGRKVASPSLAARSGLADRRAVNWSATLLDCLDLRADTLPEMLPAASVAAGLHARIARETGLLSGTPVVNAGHDHPCAGLGCGLVDPGRMIDSTGTSEALKTVVTQALSYDDVGAGAYDCYPHVVPGRFLLSGHIPSSGGLIDWLVGLLSGPDPRPDSAEALWSQAAAEPPGARGVRVAPFLEGTGAPWNRREERAGIASLGHASNAGAILRAAVESLGAWLHLNVDRFESITGLRASEITLTGGGARNALANTIKAAMLGRPLVLPDIEEAAAVGAALVAGLATGAVAHASDLSTLPDVSWRRIDADPELAAAYEAIGPALRAHITPEIGRHG